MKNEGCTTSTTQNTFTFDLKALETDLRMAESAIAFELAMLELKRIIEMAESLEWP